MTTTHTHNTTNITQSQTTHQSNNANASNTSTTQFNNITHTQYNATRITHTQ